MARPAETDSLQRPVTSASDRQSLADNRWAVLACLFFVTGALGIPLLWLGRAFSTRMKILLSLVVILYTALLLWLFWLVMLWSYHRITDSFLALSA